MLHLVCTYSIFQQNRLPQFVAHYRQLGVERFWLTPHVDSGAAGSPAALEALDALDATAHEAGVQPLPLASYEFDPRVARRHHDALQKEIPSRDWIVWADLDEFQTYPEPLADVIARAERNGEGAVGGEFVDRIDREGRLPELDTAVPLGEQFPVGCNLTATALRGFTHKVVLARSSIRVTSGNHEVLENPETFRWSESLSAVHHFKWDATVLSRSEHRLEAFRRQEIPCWTETQSFFEYMSTRQSLNLEALKTFDFEWGSESDGWAFVQQLRDDNENWRVRRGFTPVEAKD